MADGSRGLGWRQYAEQVSAGSLPASRLVRLACERSLAEFVEFGTAPTGRRARGEWWFDERAAAQAVAFFPRFLRHSKGEWAGQSFELEGWQAWLVAQLFGWKGRADGLRRFRKAYVEVPRKNGKSQLAAGIGVLLLAADGEPGAEVYSAATTRPQAALTFGEASRMVKASPALRGVVVPYRNALTVPSSSGKWEALSSDHDTADGLNPHGVIVDELHAHKRRGLLDVLETALGARRQPVLLAITTAGHGGESVCWELHEYARKVLEGHVADASFLSYVAGCDPGDDWTAPATWRKANPNFGVSVKPGYLERECEQAKAIPAKQNAFRRLHLNDWTEQKDRWLALDEWDACSASVELADVSTLRAFVGLDLSSSRDFTASVAVVPPAEPGGLWAVAPRFYIPEATVPARVRDDRVPVDAWIDAGYVTATPGDLVDFEWVKAGLRELRDELEVAEVAFDPWGAVGLAADLAGEGFPMVQFRQGFGSMAPALRELERLIVGRQLAHGGHPVLRWMASNVAVQLDAAGNVKPDKSRSSDRIDGIVALAMAVGRAALQPGSAAAGVGGLYDGDGAEVLIL